MDDSALEEAWNRIYDVNLGRELLPLYFLILYWSGTHFTYSDAVLLRETCGCDGDSSFELYSDYISKVGRPNGLEEILHDIRKTKMDFRGRKVNIFAADRNDGSWEFKWNSLVSEFSLRAAHSSTDSAFTGIFHAFIIGLRRSRIFGRIWT